jgi:large subunit ribosomal protein L21
MGYHKKVRIVFERPAVRVFKVNRQSREARSEPKPQRKGFSLVMYAVIETGGKQYRVAPGQTIEVETLAGDVGSAVEFDRVLAISNEANEMVLGDALKTARVRGTIAAHGRGDKVIVFKFKRKKQYKRTIGHRQNFTRVQVQEIVA